jgi:DNA polymerase elongation subunit (family B)
MQSSEDATLIGHNPEPGLVAVEHVPGTERDEIVLFFRRGNTIEQRWDTFEPWIWVESEALLSGAPVSPVRVEPLDGSGPFKVRVVLPHWAAVDKLVRWLHKKSGHSPTDREAPYAVLNDPVQQYLTLTGRTLFHGLSYAELRRVQLDIETETAEGFEFSNPDRESDRIIAIGLSDNTGWMEILDIRQMDEPTLLRESARRIRERDPDILEGHNIFAFDLDYILRRAKRHGVEWKVGRDGSVPAVRSGRFVAAERAVNYPRVDIFGRSIVDTYFLAQLYDVSHRSLPGLGLKEIARHFGFAREDREYIEGGEVGRTFRRDPERVRRYLEADLQETRDLAAHLTPVYVAQSRMVPMSFQNVWVRGTATKIDALMLRAYVAARHALPRPQPARSFEGGLTKVFEFGVIRNVHHCDVRSLYPSIMLADRIAPASDELGVFLQLLGRLRGLRLQARARMAAAQTPAERSFEEAIQSAFKILINSFYGYLGFEAARFNDFDAAEKIAARGRELLRAMVDAIHQSGGRCIEIDTDGIYFVPPEGEEALQRLRQAVRSALPTGVEVEFDATYPAMFSYRRKNYALLDSNGEIVITGAALRSRGLEPYLREFIQGWLELKLTGREAEIPELIQRYRRALLHHELPIQKLARTERLSENPDTYRARRDAGGVRSAAAELALASGRPYRAGDTISYYITGTRANVPIHANCKLVSDWTPERHDENIPYYVARLEELVQRLESTGDDEPEEAEAKPRRGRRQGKRNKS